MVTIVRIGAICIFSVLVALFFRSVKPEYGIYMGFAVGLLLLGYVLDVFSGVYGMIRDIREYLGETYEYLVLLMRLVAITYICDVSGSLCRDAGYQTIGSQIEVLGKLTVLLSGMPVLLSVLDTISLL
ncbi:MAG: stage III sporulation protein AD [Lachnospiraceae bacterium]|nr:stage III sporulation protein AD [Lachnospiraceae bacterium]